MFGPMMGAGCFTQRTEEDAAAKRREVMDKRQQRLDPICKALSLIAGVTNVQVDDFDSAGFNVFLNLAGSKFKLDKRLQDTKRRIRTVLMDKQIGFRFLDQPVKQYSNNGLVGEKPTDQGYNHRHIKLEVEV